MGALTVPVPASGDPWLEEGGLCPLLPAPLPAEPGWPHTDALGCSRPAFRSPEGGPHSRCSDPACKNGAGSPGDPRGPLLQAPWQPPQGAERNAGPGGMGSARHSGHRLGAGALAALLSSLGTDCGLKLWVWGAGRPRGPGLPLARPPLLPSRLPRRVFGF